MLTLETETALILEDQLDIDWGKIVDMAELQKNVEDAKFAAKLHTGTFAQVRVIILGRILARIDCGKTSSMEYQEAKPSLLRTIYNDELIMPRDEYHLLAIAEEWRLLQKWVADSCGQPLPAPRTTS